MARQASIPSTMDGQNCSARSTTGRSIHDSDDTRLSSYRTTTAVSVSQIVKLTTEKSGLVIHGHKVFNINLVALICEIIHQSRNKLIALLDDYTTGPVELNYLTDGDVPTCGDDSFKHWQQYKETEVSPDQSAFSDEMLKPIEELKENDYIRVIGQVKFINGVPKIFAFTVRYICDPNFITMHILEVIRDSLFYEKRAESLIKDSNQLEKRPRWYRELGEKELKLFLFVKDNAGARGCKFEAMQEAFNSWSPEEMNEVINNIERAGLMWQGDSEYLWVPNIHDI